MLLLLDYISARHIFFYLIGIVAFLMVLLLLINFYKRTFGKNSKHHK